MKKRADPEAAAGPATSAAASQQRRFSAIDGLLERFALPRLRSPLRTPRRAPRLHVPRPMLPGTVFPIQRWLAEAAFRHPASLERHPLVVCTHDERATQGWATLATLLPSDGSPTALLLDGLVRVAYVQESRRTWPLVRLAVVTPAGAARGDELRTAAIDILNLLPEPPAIARDFLERIQDPAELAYSVVASLDVPAANLENLLLIDDGEKVVDLALEMLKGEYKRMLALNAASVSSTELVSP